MDHKTCCSIVVVPAANGTDHPQSESQELAEKTFHDILAQLVLASSRAAGLALLAYIFVATACRAHQQPGDLAFIFGAYAALAGLLLCLRRAERLAPDSPAAERRRLHVAVWMLSTTLSCAFAYRVSLLMPAALVLVIWCMTSFVVLVGFYMLVLCKDEQYLVSVDVVNCDAASDGKPLSKKIRPSDEMV